MSSVAAFVKRALIPGSMTFLVLGCAIGVATLYLGAPGAVWGRMWLTGILGLYWILSLPAIAHLLIGGLRHQYHTIRSRADAAGANILIVLGNGSVHYTAGAFGIDQLTRRSAFCVFEAARLYQLIRPDWVIVSGGWSGDRAESSARFRSESELMRDHLVDFDIPRDRIIVESASRTTEQQISNVTRLLHDRHLQGPVVLVTTAAHMARVMALWQTRDAPAIPSAGPELRYDEGRSGWRRWYPSASALRGSESAMYEYLALVYAKFATQAT